MITLLKQLATNELRPLFLPLGVEVKLIARAEVVFCVDSLWYAECAGIEANLVGSTGVLGGFTYNRPECGDGPGGHITAGAITLSGNIKVPAVDLQGNPWEFAVSHQVYPGGTYPF